MLIIAVVVAAVAAENRGKHRTVPSYRAGSGSYDKQYEATTYATPTTYHTASYKSAESESSYQEEPVYTKSYSRPSYKTTPVGSYVTTESTPSYSKSSYEPSTYSTPSSTYPTKNYDAAEPVRSYSSNPTYAESRPYSSPAYTTTTSAPYTTSQRYSTPAYYSKQDSYDYVRSLKVI
jgi:hypothetical protein